MWREPADLCYNTGMRNEEMKQQLGRYLQAEVISLAEAAKKLNVRLDYLVDLAINGKLKSFKVGSDWYTEPKRLAEFMSNFHRQLAGELDQHLATRPSVWVKTRKRKIQPQFNFSWQFILGEAALVTVTAVVILVLVISFMPRNGYLLVYCSKYFLNRTFIPATQAAYNAPLATAASLSRSKLNDEILTKKIELLIKSSIFKRRGRVAGEMERAGF